MSAYSHTRQVGFGSGCYDDVDDPRFGLPTGGVMCLSNLTAYGVTAQPGQNIEIFQKSIDNYDTYSQDLRAASAADSTIQWLLGASGDAAPGVERIRHRTFHRWTDRRHHHQPAGRRQAGQMVGTVRSGRHPGWKLGIYGRGSL